MRKLSLLIFFSLLFILSGCSTSVSMTEFRGKKIYAGQSNDSVEKSLGEPDFVANSLTNGWKMKAMEIDSWVTPGTLTIEWVYWDDTVTLIIWLERNAVQCLWLTETSNFPEAVNRDISSN